MDLFKNLKHFFYEGGFDSLIKDFRTISDSDSFVFSAQYNSELDAVEWIDPDSYSTFDKGVQVGFFSKKLERRLDELKGEVLEQLLNLNVIAEADPVFGIDSFHESTVDFSKLRKDILANPSWTRYHHQLLTSVVDIEAVFVRNRQISSRKSGGHLNAALNSHQAISFKYKGSDEQLQKLFYELVLDTGRFIDETKTPLHVFKRIIASSDLKSETGHIWFGCETKQACYIVRQMRVLFESFDFKTIEASAKFITKNKTVLTRNMISRNNSSMPKQKNWIDKFFTRLIM